MKWFKRKPKRRALVRATEVNDFRKRFHAECPFCNKTTKAHLTPAGLFVLDKYCLHFDERLQQGTAVIFRFFDGYLVNDDREMIVAAVEWLSARMGRNAKTTTSSSATQFSLGGES